ncbi:MAG: MFS transporter [Acidimicrobiia bacterium]|nr:MFS transporter [Acidimicrobiia bacterium]
MAGVLLVLAFGGFVALGLGDGALGVAWPSVATAFERDLSELGVLIAVGVAGYLLASLLTGRLERRFGIGVVLVVSAVLMGAGFAGYAGARVWPVVLVAQFAAGAGGALVDAGLNTYVALHHSARSMHFLHASFGIGATIGPVLMATAIGLGSGWRAGYVVLALAQAVLLVSFLRLRSTWGAPRAPVRGAGVVPGRAGAVLGVAVFLVYTGVEVAAGQWAYTVLTEHRSLTTSVGGAVVAGYWGALTAGRLATGFVAARVTSRSLLVGGTALALAGLGVFWWGGGPLDGGTGLFLTGLGLAPVFPALVLLTPDRVGSERTSGAVGHQLAAAGAGALLVPAGIGLVVDASSLGAVGPSLVAVAALLAVGAAGLVRLQGLSALGGAGNLR